MMQTIDQIAPPADDAPKQANKNSQPSWGDLPGVGHTLVIGAVAAAVLLWVAVYNGFPTVLPDSGNYISVGAFRIALAPFRAPGYSVFTHWSSFAGRSAWYTVIMQAIIVAYVLQETYNYLVEGDRKFLNQCLLAGVCGLAVLTSLPWVVSELMPDVFAGVVFLSAFLLAFAKSCDRCSVSCWLRS